MDSEQQAQLLKNIFSRDCIDLLEPSMADFVFDPQPCLQLVFERGRCEWLEDEAKALVFVDIHTARCVGVDLPHLRFTTYFPYPLHIDNVHLDFLLYVLFELYKEMPFVEVGANEGRDGKIALSFRCCRLIASDKIEAPEILFFVQRVVVALEWFVPAYEAGLKKAGIRVT